MKTLCAVLMAGMLSGCLAGCATLGRVTDTALTIGGKVRPDYAAVLKEISHLIAREPANPVEGWDFIEIWYFEGRVVPATAIERERRFTERMTAEDGFSVVIREPADAVIEREAELRKEIEAILEASGVLNER